MAAAENIDMRPLRLLGRRRSSSLRQRCVDQPDRHLDPAAAALADLGAERDGERPALRRVPLDVAVLPCPCSTALALSSAMYSSCPPPIVP